MTKYGTIVLSLVLVLLVCWQNAKAFNVRYMLVSLPAFICVVAVGLGSFPRTASRVLTVLVFLTLLFSLSSHYFDRRYAKEDVRGAASYLEAVAGDDECILAPTVMYVVAHYLDGRNGVYGFHSPAGTSRSATADPSSAMRSNPS